MVVQTWADGFGNWHCRVTLDEPASRWFRWSGPLVGRVRTAAWEAIREELTARQSGEPHFGVKLHTLERNESSEVVAAVYVED